MTGLAGSQLVDPVTDAVCTVTSVLSDTTLRCENPEPDDGDLTTLVDQNPITFADGVEYRIAGNTLAYLVQILDAIDGLADYLETAIGDSGFTDPLPIVGVSPAEMVEQVQKLRDMVDEFRGVQDGQITCGVEGDATADIRAIPIATAGGTAQLNCHATATAAAVSEVRWRITGDGQNSSWVSAADGTVGAGPDTVALSVKAPNTDHDGYVQLGDEYGIEVEWLDGTESNNAALPPRTPQSLQSLAKEVTKVLGLPSGALEFILVDAADPDLRTLRINLGYGICSDPAPANTSQCNNMPTAPAPEVNVQLDLGGSLPALIGLETTGTIDVRFAALGQFDIGIPLDGDVPVLYGTTGLDARLEVNGTNLGITASLGPVGATVGSGAGGMTGTVEGDSDTTLTDDEALLHRAERPGRCHGGQHHQRRRVLHHRAHRRNEPRVRTRLGCGRRVQDRRARRAPRRREPGGRRPRRRRRRARPDRVRRDRRRRVRFHPARGVPRRRRRLRRHRPERRRGRLRRGLGR